GLTRPPLHSKRCRRFSSLMDGKSSVSKLRVVLTTLEATATNCWTLLIKLGRILMLALLEAFSATSQNSGPRPRRTFEWEWEHLHRHPLKPLCLRQISKNRRITASVNLGAAEGYK